MIEQGECEVLVMGHGTKKETFIKDIGPGSLFGEIALLFEIPRTASVKSKQFCTIAAINKESLI